MKLVEGKFALCRQTPESLADMVGWVLQMLGTLADHNGPASKRDAITFQRVLKSQSTWVPEYIATGTLKSKYLVPSYLPMYLPILDSMLN